jgi:xanthine dehydrogenase large subunit
MFEPGRNREKTIYRSKAVGEPPLMLALSVFHAIRDAVASVGGEGCRPPLTAPATPEAILAAIDAVRPARASCLAPTSPSLDTEAGG